MATKKRKSTAWMDDGDDAHFSDNPAVPKRTRKKWRAEEKIRVGAGASGRTGKYVRSKKKTSRKRVAGK